MSTAMAAIVNSSIRLSSAEIPAQIDLLISLRLHLWPALTLSIQNAWGTSSPQISADKRDWLAGALSDLFAQNQLRDLEDLEDVLEQVMSDEFEVVVDDGSLEEVARKIWSGVKTVRGGEGKEVKALQQEWESKRGKSVQGTQVEGNDGSTDEEDDEEWNGFADNGDGGVDVDMDEAPALIESRPKIEPEVDEDGFTKVVGRRRK
jgi:pre-rRNA-processing protein TSR2